MSANSVLVYMDKRLVGEIVETSDHKYAFSYSDEWLQNGFNISPFSLPMEKKVFVPSKAHFEGLFGVFADSLPDSWGRLLVDRMLAKQGIALSGITPLDRLCIVGETGIGALSYEPKKVINLEQHIDDLDVLCKACQDLLAGRGTNDLDELFALGGSSGGARPKVIGEEWIVKFPTSGDSVLAGVMEKEYMDCAEQCGIQVPQTKLYPSRNCAGYFAVERFDRKILPDGTVRRYHVLTAAALLEIDWRTPSLDYHALMKLTKIICSGSKEALLEMYRRMCFNVFAHNQDDHAKNFSFIFDEDKRIWHLSPAYDLTYSNTYYGEHTTMVDGNGKNPGLPELINVGVTAGLSAKICRQIAAQIEQKTRGLAAKHSAT